MVEKYDIEICECPGCGRRFKRADIKTDRIKCPACGREISSTITVIQQDERRLVEQFLNENGIGTVIVSYPGLSPFMSLVASVSSFVAIIVAILYTGFSFWRLMWVAFFLWVIKFAIGRYYGPGRKVRSLFEKSGYDLELGLAEYNAFISKLGEIEREKYCYEGGEFEKKLRTYVRSHVDIQNKFEARVGSECGKPDASQCQYENVQKMYAIPPDVCPSCGAPYRVGDFNAHSVSCRKCGTEIGVSNVVSDEELHDLLVWFVSKWRKENSIGWNYFFLVSCAVMTVWNISESGILDFLCSWSVLWMYATIGCVYVIRRLMADKRRYDYFLRQKRINLFEFEFYVKNENSGNGTDVDIFYGFKERLMDLYRKSGSMVKGSELT